MTIAPNRKHDTLIAARETLQDYFLLICCTISIVLFMSGTIFIMDSLASRTSFCNCLNSFNTSESIVLLVTVTSLFLGSLVSLFCCGLCLFHSLSCFHFHRCITLLIKYNINYFFLAVLVRLNDLFFDADFTRKFFARLSFASPLM